MIEEKTFWLKENTWQIAVVQGDDYTSGFLLNYNYFKNYCRMIAISLSKQQALDTDPKAIEQIKFTANLDWEVETAMNFITEEAKETIADFSDGIARVL